MWPLILDMTKEESIQTLRCLELEAYASLVSALRAQGPLNTDKVKLLRDTGHLLNITQERHKAEIRRAVNDEKLTTIAYHVSGQNGYSEDWAQEGRRSAPLMPRTAPQTAYSAIADEVADSASINNKQLPLPAATERKRNQNQMQINVPENSKNVQFRLPETTKTEESKKRKLPLFAENSNFSHQVMGPPKISKIQQIYRQRTKARLKEQMHLKMKQDQVQFRNFQHQDVQTSKLPLSPNSLPSSGPKINILQNISLHPSTTEESDVDNDVNNFTLHKAQDRNSLSPQPGCSNENQAPRPKQVIANNKSTQSLTIKPVSTSTNSEVQKSIKICPRKSLTKTVNPGQKLIVVSNAHTLTTNSILQRTLTIPFVKNLSVKNFDKFKIVTTTTTTPSNVQGPITTIPSCYTTNSMKHKVVTVRTNSATKKVSLSHLQVLNAKGSIKVLPFGSKLLTKAAPSPSANLYIMNTAENNSHAVTKSTTSTPVLMSVKPQENTAESVMVVEENKVKGVQEGNRKSSILADILKASGVTPADNEIFTDDIESQISQLTAIPQTDEEQTVNKGGAPLNVESKDIRQLLAELEGDAESPEPKVDEIAADDTDACKMSFGEIEVQTMACDNEQIVTCTEIGKTESEEQNVVQPEEEVVVSELSNNFNES